jgi:O-acetyl-ADP-ribose deacetylase (regulator of RNase III)
VALTVKQTTENIWRLHDLGWFVVVPTNLYVKNDRTAVMGRGIAQQASHLDPQVPALYGELLLTYVRNHVPPGKVPRLSDLNVAELIQADFGSKMVFFPTKLTWNEDSNLDLIEKSFDALKKWLASHSRVEKVAIPRVGAGNGHLDWESAVKPLMKAFLEDLDDSTRSRLAIVHPPEYLRSMQFE